MLDDRGHVGHRDAVRRRAPDYFENDGLGWDGPLLVRLRYGASP